MSNNDARYELENQVKVLAGWLENHAYNDYYTREKARKALFYVLKAFDELERRSRLGLRRGPYNHKGDL